MRFDGRLAGPICVLVAALALAAPAPAQNTPPPAQTAPPPARADDTYHLRADRLEGSANSNDDVYTAIHVTVEHGSTTVTGDSAHVYRQREQVEVMGHVKIVDGKTTMWGDEATYDRKTRLAVLRGNVRIEEGTARITGAEARFYRNENRSVIVGSPRMQDSTRTVTADQIDYDRGQDVVLATGNVVAVDRAESTSVRAGRVRYERRKDYAWATQNPSVTLEESGGKSTLIKGLTIEFDNAKRAVVALGNVEVERDKLRAKADRGEFYEKENRALLVGKPRAWDEEGEVQGDTLEIRFAQHRVETVQVRPHATVKYEAKSERGRGERNEAVGDTVTLFNPDEETRHAVIVGHAKSSYWPASADSAQGGRNTSSGDSIIVEFAQGRARRATVVGQGDGTYYMAAEGDTNRAQREERVRYRGDRIVYDVDKNEVDVLGSAEVTYKELRLNAAKVTFNTKTERMRAEGNPILNDEKDRITGNTMTYDLSIRRGTIYGGKTTYAQGYYYGEQIRKVSEDVLDVKNGSYTTCDLDEPHYHFGSSKMRILLHDKVIVRPVVFYIKNIPVLALPFYVFPIKPGRHSGFQLPQIEFGSSSAGGKFIRNLGYYWAVSDYMDATLWGDYYQDARWIAHSQTRYQKRYKWSGEINSSFAHTLGSGSDDWDLFGRHYQVLGSNFTLTGQGNLTNSSNYLRDRSIGRSVLLRVQRNLRSTLSLSKRWSGASFDMGLVRNQDLDPDPGGLRLQQQLPSVNFSLSARPLGHLPRGKEKARFPWLSSTLFSFSSKLLSERDQFFQSRPETAIVLDSLGAPTDTVLSRSDVKTEQTALRHDLALSDVRTLLGFVRIGTGMSYSEIFYSKDAAGNRNQRAGVWRGNLSANTAVFGTFRPSIGPLRAVRHVLTPSVGLVYQPAYPKLNYRDPAGNLIPRFNGVPGISLTGAEARLMTFSLRNDVHVKWGSPSQPKVRNNLLQLQTSGTYNMLAVRSGAKPLSDLFSTLRIQPVDKSSVDMNFTHNPYDGKLLRFGVSSGLFFQGVTRSQRQEAKADLDPAAQAVSAPTGWNPPGLIGSDLPWTFSISMSHTGSSSRLPAGGYSRWNASTTGNGSLGLNPTRNWRVDYTAQFDFESRKMISQYYSVKRELHCWEAQFTRSISGGFTEYYFKINVKNLPEVYYEQGSRGLRGFGGIQNAF
jgi:lipopolysaccharide assembly outer membrane protein LptD (OstA)